MTLQQFLARHDLHLTITNPQDEAVYIGKAEVVKPLKTGNLVRFPAKVFPDSVYPYTRAILHDQGNIYAVVEVNPVRVTSGMKVELVLP